MCICIPPESRTRCNSHRILAGTSASFHHRRFFQPLRQWLQLPASRPLPDEMSNSNGFGLDDSSVMKYQSIMIYDEDDSSKKFILCLRQQNKVHVNNRIAMMKSKAALIAAGTPRLNTPRCQTVRNQKA